MYLLGAGDFLFCWRYRGTLEKDGSVCVGMERGTPEEGGIGPGVDAVVDAVEVCGWMERGTPEEGGIGPGRDSIGGYY